MTTATQFVFPQPYYNMVCKRLADFEVWLAHCVNRGLKVQISASDLALLLGEVK